jgi:CheY-like chemotaxis protein
MGRFLRISIADDDPLNLALLHKSVLSLGHEVVSSAQTGDELIQDCRRVHPDLIVSDVTMPEKDGLEAVQAINEEYRIPAILVSARLDLADLLAGSDYVVARLAKPISAAELKSAIQSAFPAFASQS